LRGSDSRACIFSVRESRMESLAMMVSRSAWETGISS
jgi:hypothetical protein